MNKLQLVKNYLSLSHHIHKSPQKIRTEQQKKLHDILHYAYDHSAYYRKTFEAKGITKETIDTADITSFPILNKKTLMENFDEIVTVNIRQEDLRKFDETHDTKTRSYLDQYHLVHSSGSTGTSRYFLYDEDAWNMMLAGIMRGAFWKMSFSEIIKLLRAKPRVLYLAATDGRYGGAMAVGDGIEDLGGKQYQLDINTPLKEWKQIIEDLDPNVLIGYPSAVKILTKLFQEKKIAICPERIITCGEPLARQLRTFIEEVFSCPLINFYGASESLAMGVESSSEEGMILFDDLNYIEIIDGRMYITCLYNKAQPLIRYQILDSLRLKEEPLPDCGFTHCDTVEGRDEDIIWLLDTFGRLDFLHPLSVEGICADGLRDYQFIQLSLSSFEVKAEINEGADKEYIRKEMNDIISSILHEKQLKGIQFSIHFVEQLYPDNTTGKKQLVVPLTRS